MVRRYVFYFLVAKTIFYSLTALVRKILFCHSKIEFISSRPRVISSLYIAHILIYYHENRRKSSYVNGYDVS